VHKAVDNARKRLRADLTLSNRHADYKPFSFMSFITAISKGIVTPANANWTAVVSKRLVVITYSSFSYKTYKRLAQ